MLEKLTREVNRLGVEKDERDSGDKGKASGIDREAQVNTYLARGCDTLTVVLWSGRQGGLP